MSSPAHAPCRGHLFHRTTMLLGKPAMERLANIRVALFGVGGVGSWTAEALIRSGVDHLTLVDSDDVCSTNVNRQLQATTVNIGQSKVGVLKKRLLEINPSASIEAHHLAYTAKTCEQFDLKQYHYVLDAIDSLQNKVMLIERGLEAGATVYSCMGAGAKLDPTRIKAGPLSRTRMCPLARMVRKRLGKKCVTRDFLCVYSEEVPIDPLEETFCGTGQCACSHPQPAPAASANPASDDDNPDWCARKTQVNGTVVHVTAVFGFTLAGLVIQDVVKSCKGSPCG